MERRRIMAAKKFGYARVSSREQNPSVINCPTSSFDCVVSRMGMDVTRISAPISFVMWNHSL
mgnify:CR=1 FL=1